MWRLIAGWGTVLAFTLFGGDLLAKSVLEEAPLEALLFVWILGVVLWCAFGAVVLSILTFSGPRTTVLEGAVHLLVFFVYVVLIFSP